MNAQNLVPNPSFEIMDSCPYPFSGDISYAKYWLNPTIYSPDYFNACDTSDKYFSVPNNSYGLQFAKTGVAYAGIITMYSVDGREYIQTALIDTLISGRKYCVEFYVSASEGSGFASNDIGVYFSKTAISSNSTQNLPYIPQVSNNPATNPLNNKDEWIKVSDVFLSQGGEKYITIGNFKDDISTDTSNFINGSWNASYYYIDDISIYLCDSITGLHNYNIENIMIFPNPSSGLFTVNFGHLAFKNLWVFNSVGQNILTPTLSEIQNSKSYLIDISQHNDGIYFLRMETENFSTINKLFLNH